MKLTQEIDQFDLFKYHGEAELTLPSVSIITLDMSPQLLVASGIAWLSVSDRSVIPRAWNEYHR